MKTILTGLVLFVVLAAGSPLGAEEASLQGEWALDLKASVNVADSQKNVDLKIAIRGNQLTTTRLVAGKQVGNPIVLTLDGSPRQMEVAPGQGAVVDAKWLERGKKVEQNVKMSGAGPAGLGVTQKIVSAVSEDGASLTRTQTMLQAGETTERVLVYRRKG